ncbi:glycogen debranching enzyme [Spinellus fusiger]|nr:glycogen debranching enzyme [Spinellus fusiger]
MSLSIFPILSSLLKGGTTMVSRSQGESKHEAKRSQGKKPKSPSRSTSTSLAKNEVKSTPKPAAALLDATSANTKATRVIDPKVPFLYTVTLGDDGSPQDTSMAYIRIPLTEQTTLIRFVLKTGTLAAGGRPTLHTNYPIQGTFVRDVFHAVPFERDEKLLGAYCDITYTTPGVYEYYVEYTSVHNALRVSLSGFIVAEPRLQVQTSQGKKPLPLDALMVLSVVPKWMGPVSRWKDQLNLIQHSGYNMIHFVPMQKRGSSDSPYSISDPLSYADDLFDAKDMKKSPQEKAAIIRTLMETVQTKHGILCLSDVVWNHTSNDSPFLLEHPEAGYNLHTSPHLVPAYELDTAFVALSENLGALGLPSRISSPGDVDRIMAYATQNTVPELRLYEYFVVAVAAQKKLFEKALASKAKCDPQHYLKQSTLGQLSFKEQADLLGQDAISSGNLGERFHKSLDISHALSLVLALHGMTSIKETQGKEVVLVETLGRLLDEYNLPFYKTYDEDIKVALENIKQRLVFTRLDDHGPKLGEITKSAPIVETYFTRLESKQPHPPGSMQLVNNGWIWNADPMLDFAGPESKAYFRREVIVWGDCVKLRYGASPKENPWLWNHMRTYTEHIARLFQGIRIDNCHSTPLHVAEYLLDAARAIQPDLYVLAELFTGSPEKDNLFVSRLGIHSLVREAMQAWDTHELSRLVHRHGGKPVGSMDQDMTWKCVPYNRSGFEQVYSIPVSHGSTPRALFMDCTHDNETPFQKRLAQDTLPNAAVVAFSDCATGSVKGYDEVYPYHLNLVSERRLYAPRTAAAAGIVDIKHQLQKLHLKMSIEGYSEVHVHQENDYLLVHRQHPGSQEGYLLIARTAFPNASTGISPIKLHRTKTEFVLGASLGIKGSTAVDTKVLSGLPTHVEHLSPPVMLQQEDDKGDYTQVVLPDVFPPGSVYVIKTSIGNTYRHVRSLITTMEDAVLKDFTLLDCNVVLYRSEGEEMDATGGHGIYAIPRHGKLVYAGLQGFMSVLVPIITNNDLGHPMCDNLRAGKWMLDYVSDRLSHQRNASLHLGPLHEWFSSRFELVKQMPDFLVPKYFAMTLQTAYDKVYARALSLMSPWIHLQGDPFTHQLAMTSVQLHGTVPSTALHPTRSTPCLAAGLPHFTTGAFRTWGRDTFISMRGLFLVTGQFSAARDHLLSFASSLKHGLIPNLLDSVRVPRYNARDAVWFFMQAIQDYYLLAPNGPKLLSEKVLRRFPKDDQFVPVEEGYQYASTLAEIMQEVLQRHAQGIHFREYNAGEAIDRQMQDRGFDVDINVDWETGVLVGGNEFNCGTWMDKMGESEKAHNKGVPGTSRNGAPIEITGLLKSALRFVLELQKKKQFRWEGVKVHGKMITYQHWNDLLQKNFEKIYYVPKDASEDSQYAVDPRIIHRRGIYKDVWRAVQPYTEYQFRSNFPIAMAVAPELFDKKHATECLLFAKEVLLGPLGMCTLDPADQEYRPYYDNSNDSDDFKVAKGRNYHQGPEWLWQTGFYLRAAYKFGALSKHEISRILRPHREQIITSPWCGLVELTNKSGEKCWDSCETQAWSTATLLDLLYDMISQ